MPKPLLSRRPPFKLPLRWVLIVPFLLQTVGTVALVGYLCHRSGQQAVTELADQLMLETGDRVSHHLHDYFKAPQQQVQENQTAIQMGLLDWRNAALLESYFVRQLSIHPDVSGMMIATEARDFLAVGRAHADQLAIRQRNRATGAQDNYAADLQGKRLYLQDSLPNYDPHTTPAGNPWYSATQQTPAGLWQSVVTVVRGKDQPLLMMAYFLPFIDSTGKFQGVLSASAHSDRIGAFLQSIRIGKTGQAFVVDDQGYLVATSTNELPFRQNLTTAEKRSLAPEALRLAAQNSSDPVTQAAATWSNQPADADHTGWFGTIQLQNRPYFGRVIPFRLNDQINWKIVVVIPEADFMAQIQANIYRTLFFCGLALLGGIALGWLIAQKITQPLLALNQATQAFTAGNPVLLPKTTAIQEVDALQRSLKRMMAELDVSLQALQENQQMLQTFLNSVPVGLSIHAASGQMIFINDQGKRILKTGVQSATMSQLAEVYRLYLAGSNQLYPVEQLPMARGLQGETVNVDDIEVDVGGQRVLLSVNTTPVFNEAAQVIYAINAFEDITERRQIDQLQAYYQQKLESQIAEQTQALRESEAQLQLITDSVPGCIFYVDAEQRYRFVNQTYEIWWSCSKHNMLGRTIAEVIGPDAYREIQPFIERVLTGETVSYEVLLPYPNQRRYIFGVLVPDQDEQGSVQGFYALLTDISDRKIAEMALQKSEERFHEIASTISQMFFVRSVAPDHYLYVSPAYDKIWGRSRDDLLNNPTEWMDAVHPDDRDFVFNSVNLQMQGNSVYREYRIIRPDGAVRWVAATVSAILDADGRPLRFVGLAEDISDRKQLELALQASEAKLKDILDSAIAAITSFRMFANGRWEYCYRSKGCETLFGYTDEEFFQNPQLWESRVPPEDIAIASIASHLEDIMAERTFVVEYRFLHRDGSLRWLDTIFISRRDQDADCWIVTAVGTDITNRKRAEEQLKVEFDLRRAIEASIVEGIAIVDLQGRQSYVNPAFCRMVGWQAEELLGATPPFVYWPPEEIDRITQALHSCLIGERPASGLELRFMRRNGERFDVLLLDAPLYDDQGEPTAWLASVYDITARKQAERELQQAKEAAELANQAKNSFLANMSHELRTPLNSILGFTQLIKRDVALSSEYPSDHQEYIDLIYNSGVYLLKLINQVLDLAKIEAGALPVEAQLTDLFGLFHLLKDTFSRSIQDKGVLFELDVDPSVPQCVIADAQKLQQVLINLIGNAVKFTEQGKVTLRVCLVPSGDQKDRAVLASAPLLLHFEIEDTGVGIAPQDLPIIFDAFVQAAAGKQIQEGTGIGLTISRKLVQVMGGEITVRSILGQGSTFQLTIPVQPAGTTGKAHALAKQVIGLAADQPAYRLLVVDDQVDNLLLMVTLLKSLGFAVETAMSGETAIALWQQWHPHLICMDIRMPGLNGYETTQHIRWLEQAQLPVSHALPTVIIALTAQASMDERLLALAAGCDDYISKPFELETLLSKMSKHLGVQYAYAEQRQVAAGSLLNHSYSLTAEQLVERLTAMPRNWVMQLHEAVMSCEQRAVKRLIQQIPPEQAPLTSALNQLINNFNFDQIMQLTQTCLDRTEPS